MLLKATITAAVVIIGLTARHVAGDDTTYMKQYTYDFANFANQNVLKAMMPKNPGCNLVVQARADDASVVSPESSECLNKPHLAKSLAMKVAGIPGGDDGVSSLQSRK